MDGALADLCIPEASAWLRGRADLVRRRSFKMR